MDLGAETGRLEDGQPLCERTGDERGNDEERLHDAVSENEARKRTKIKVARGSGGKGPVKDSIEAMQKLAHYIRVPEPIS